MEQQQLGCHHHLHHEKELNIDDPTTFDRKIDVVTADARPFVKEHLLTRITRENCLTIVNYMLAMQTEVSPTETYRIDTLFKLKYFAEFHNPKTVKDMTRQDVIDFLDKFRKPESVDPLHKWIGTYESYRIVLMRFFRWLHSPDLPQSKRPRPAVMENIPRIRRKEVSIYKPTDLWTEEDDFIFYKYCPSLRDRCWHAVSRDTGCRPHELLRLKIKDIVVQQLDNGYQIARITVNGKTGSRNVRLNNSYPRLKDWLTNGHPFAGNPNTYLFCGSGRKNTGRRLTGHSINAMYERYKKIHFPKLLDDPLVPEEDKLKIRDLLKKRWNPYVRRHTAATEISKTLKDSVLIDQYMGWSHKGNTRRKYPHYYNDDSFDAMLTMMDGLKPNSSFTRGEKGLLKPKQCPNCSESNKPEAKFCSKCKFVLSFEAFNETVKSADEKEKELNSMQGAISNLEKVLPMIMDKIERMNKQLAEANGRVEKQQLLIEQNGDKT